MSVRVKPLLQLPVTRGKLGLINLKTDRQAEKFKVVARDIHHATSITLSGSDVEAFTTTTFAAQVRVVELEAFIEPFLYEVQLGTVEVGQALRVDHHFNAAKLEHLIFRLAGVNKLQYICHPGAAGCSNTQAYTLTVASLLQVASDMIDRRLCHANCHNHPSRGSIAPASLTSAVSCGSLPLPP